MKVKIINIDSKEASFILNNNLIKVPVEDLTFEVKKGDKLEAVKDNDKWILLPQEKMKWATVVGMNIWGLIGVIIGAIIYRDQETPKGFLLYTILMCILHMGLYNVDNATTFAFLWLIEIVVYIILKIKEI